MQVFSRRWQARAYSPATQRHVPAAALCKTLAQLLYPLAPAPSHPGCSSPICLSLTTCIRCMQEQAEAPDKQAYHPSQTDLSPAVLTETPLHSAKCAGRRVSRHFCINLYSQWLIAWRKKKKAGLLDPDQDL